MQMVTGSDRSRTGWLRGFALALLALAQVCWAGYQFGVGNQSIQVAFLQRLHDPALFTRDEMVARTLGSYPSFFFRLLAGALDAVAVEPLYLLLHLVTSVAMLAAVVALARAAFGRSPWIGLVAVLFLVGGHHQALAEQTLYSTGFTHTWAVLPLSVGALALLYAGRPAAAFLLAGAICNLHALEGGQLGLVFGFWAACSVRQLGWRRLAALPALFVLAASPALLLMAQQHEVFDARWLELMRLRSGHNSFPFDAWQAGRTALPRFAALASLAALAFSLAPRGPHRRKTLLLMLGVALLFAAGTMFTEVWPCAIAVRAQLLRASRFALVLLLVYIAAGCVGAWSLPFAAGRETHRWRGWLEFAAAALVAACVALPAWLPLLPLSLALTLLAALVSGRLHWVQAALAGAGLLVCLVAWRSLHFALPGLGDPLSLAALVGARGPGWFGWGALAGGVALWWLAGRRMPRAAALAAAGAALVGGAWILSRQAPHWLCDSVTAPEWAAVQRWARAATPVDALFLTPIQPDGFRMLSQRAIVGEWRDGTQLYFSGAYTAPWWTRMNDLQPDMRPDPAGRRLLVRGRSLSQLSDADLLALAAKYEATHVVVESDPPRRLRPVYTNRVWTVYVPEMLAAANAPGAAAQREQDVFLNDVVRPNIVRHRQGDVRLDVRGVGGRPVYDAQYRVRQVRGTCNFGVSFPWFAPPPAGALHPRDFSPPPVTAAQLAAVRGVFDHTVLTYSAWWSSLEPERDRERYDDLDRAVAWCATNGIAVEFSFLSGFPPAWLRDLPPAEQAARLRRHALGLVERYGARVAFWQVSDQELFAEQTPDLIRALRAKYPGIVLGIGAAARFIDASEPGRDGEDAWCGLDELRRLQDEGAAVDFVSLHGCRPWGLWADARAVYKLLDAYAAAGVRVHISAFSAPAEGGIEGPVRTGRWDARLQAEYAARFFTVAYSHPAVDAINYGELGPVTRQPGAGLLDAGRQPRPVWQAIRDLVSREWRPEARGPLPLDGRIDFRAPRGLYELEIRTAGGASARARFDVTTAGTNSLRFRLGSGGGLTLEAPAAVAAPLGKGSPAQPVDAHE